MYVYIYIYIYIAKRGGGYYGLGCCCLELLDGSCLPTFKICARKTLFAGPDVHAQHGQRSTQHGKRSTTFNKTFDRSKHGKRSTTLLCRDMGYGQQLKRSL